MRCYSSVKDIKAMAKMISRAVLILVATTYMAVGKPTSEYATPAETYDTPMADKSPEYTVEKIVDYDYAVNDYYGNEQSKREHIEAGKQTGEYRTRLANGDLQIVNYDSGDEYGHRATVENIPKDHPAPEYMGYKAPVAATATSAMTDAYTAPAMTDAYAAPAMTDAYAAPAMTDAYAAPAMTDAYAAPAKTDAYAAPAKTDAYAAPAKTDAYAAPAKTDAYAAPAMTDAYAAPAMTDAYSAPAMTDAYSAPAMTDAYSAPAMTDAYTAPAMTDTYAAPAMTSYSSAPSYTTPAPYSHASSTVRYMIRKKLYVQPAPQTYTAPAVVVSPMVPEVPKMHYNYEEKNTYMASPTYMTKAY